MIGRFLNADDEKETSSLTDEEFIASLRDTQMNDDVWPDANYSRSKTNPKVGEKTVKTQFEFTVATHAHILSNEEEKERVKQSQLGIYQGEYVFHKKSRQLISVTRAIGDCNFKESGGLSNLCQVSEFEMEEGDWILLFCDGLYEQMPNDDIVRVLDNEIKAAQRQMFGNTEKDIGVAVGNLLDTVVASKSWDNLSVVFVRLGPGKGEEYSRFVPGPIFTSGDHKLFWNIYSEQAAEFGFEDEVKLKLMVFREQLGRLGSPQTCQEWMTYANLEEYRQKNEAEFNCNRAAYERGIQMAESKLESEKQKMDVDNDSENEDSAGKVETKKRSSEEAECDDTRPAKRRRLEPKET